MNHLSSLIASQHSLELSAHVSVDDAIIKAYEEAHELSVAIREKNSDDIQKEARDVLINILSVSGRFVDLDNLFASGAILDSNGIFETDTVISSHLLFDSKNYSSKNLPDSPQDILSSDLSAIQSDASLQIHSLVAQWGRETASIRNRYSREKISLQTYQKTVARIIAFLAMYIGSDIDTAIRYSLEKFQSRVLAYLPPINLKSHISEHQDFPKPGILFRDISPLLANPEALRFACFELAKSAQNADVIAGLDARGFIFGTRVAEILGKPFVMIRKKGKLPGKTVGIDYSLEYGDNSIEIQSNAIRPGESIVIIDDLLATGGTLAAAAELVEKVGGKVEALICFISLDDAFLKSQPAREKLDVKYGGVKSIL